MNAVIEDILRTGKVTDSTGTVHDVFPASILPKDGEAMFQLSSAPKPLNTLELGMAYGLSTLYICQALRNNAGGAHIAVDPYQTSYYKNSGRINVERAGLTGLVTVNEQQSYKALPKLMESGLQLDFAFVDGNHRFEFILLDFLFIDRMLNVGGHVMFHDLWMPSTRKAISFIARNRRGVYEIVPEHLQPHSSLANGLVALGKGLKQSPMDIGSALYFARKRTHNYFVLRKVKHETDQELDDAWTEYHPF